MTNDNTKPLPQPTGPFDPTVSLLVKLGSIAIHAEEMLSPGGHEYDRIALQQLLGDAEVKSWMAQMDGLAFLPKKRTS